MGVSYERGTSEGGELCGWGGGGFVQSPSTKLSPWSSGLGVGFMVQVQDFTIKASHLLSSQNVSFALPGNKAWCALFTNNPHGKTKSTNVRFEINLARAPQKLVLRVVLLVIFNQL